MVFCFFSLFFKESERARRRAEEEDARRQSCQIRHLSFRAPKTKVTPQLQKAKLHHIQSISLDFVLVTSS